MRCNHKKLINDYNGAKAGLFDYKDMIATISGGIILLLTQLLL